MRLAFLIHSGAAVKRIIGGRESHKKKKPPVVTPYCACPRGRPARSGTNSHGRQEGDLPKRDPQDLQRLQTPRRDAARALESERGPAVLGIPHEDRKDDQARPASPRRKAPDGETSGAQTARSRGTREARAARARRYILTGQRGRSQARRGARVARRGARPRRDRKRAARSAHAARASPNRSGPSGMIHVPAEAKKKGVALSPNNATSPARGPEQLRRQPVEEPAGRSEQRDERQPRAEPLAGSEPGKMRDPLMERRMIEIGQAEMARDGKRVGFVDAEARTQKRRRAARRERQARLPPRAGLRGGAPPHRPAPTAGSRGRRRHPVTGRLLWPGSGSAGTRGRSRASAPPLAPANGASQPIAKR